MTSRRIFLQQAGLGAAVAGSLVSPLAGAMGQKKDRLGVALVGLGYYSTDLLAPALQQTKNCYLAGIVTGTPAKAEQWTKKYSIPEKNVYNYQNFDQIANNPDIDVVYVVLPPSMHREYVVRAANAGKHVWVEKPMAVTAKECQDMIDACRNNKRTLAVGYRLQHEPNTQEYIRQLRSGKLGKIKTIQCSAGYREGRTNHWKQKKEMGGGVMYDMGVYVLQGARLSAGTEPVEVAMAEQSTTRPEVYRNGLDETSKARLIFPGGVVADVHTSFGESLNTLNVTCEKGFLKMEPWQQYAGLRGESSLGKIEFPYQVPWQQAKQMDDDAMAIMKNQRLIAPGEEGLRDIRIVEAIYKAAATGKPVKI